MWSPNTAQQRSETSPDARAARLAAGQWGVLHYDELIDVGLSAQAIRTRVGRGILHPLYRAVFAWGHHNIAVEGRFLAAVKACGKLAVLSHYSAAALRALVKWDGRPFEITAPTKHAHPRIKAHRSERIEREVLKGIPVTPKLRTIIDLRRVESDDVVKRALRAARFNAAELERLPRSIVDLGAVPTRSPLEDRAYDLVVGLGFEPPLSNPPYRLAGRTVYPDLYWPHLRLIVEVDSREWHDDPLARRDDMERQAELEAAGERVLRFSSAELGNPGRVAKRLRAAGVR
ncbi:DUF559 domain-containing protein [Solirubrobacter soli]|uniref:DUF559 domain-containing protein n=1 Tax=Solirubrobacter soli TaxID=363832 RepID=UPI0004153E6F|nr:DUF559 domain-containing protein [Solirubrobacter soli]